MAPPCRARATSCLNPDNGAWMAFTPFAGFPRNYTSSDGGGSWNECAKPDDGRRGLTRAWFISAQDGWAIGLTDRRPGYSFEVDRTSDGGCEWTRIWTLPDNADNEVNSIFFLNRFTGWVGGIEQIRSTSDGGYHWSVHHGPRGTKIVSLFFQDAKHGWLLAAPFGESGGIYVTHNGGHNWKPLATGVLSRKAMIPAVGAREIPLQWNRGRLAMMISYPRAPSSLLIISMSPQSEKFL